MNLYQNKNRLKETHESRFGLCSLHQRKAKFICDKDNFALLCSECIISHLGPNHSLISLVECKKTIS